MAGLNSNIPRLSPPPQEEETMEEKKKRVEGCIVSLIHACRCYDDTCVEPGCLEMKRVVEHVNMCDPREDPACPMYKQLVVLGCYHSRHCQEHDCPVPFCSKIRNKLDPQELQQQLEEVVAEQKRLADSLISRLEVCWKTWAHLPDYADAVGSPEEESAALDSALEHLTSNPDHRQYIVELLSSKPFATRAFLVHWQAYQLHKQLSLAANTARGGA